jgi:hypothetical protein
VARNDGELAGKTVDEITHLLRPLVRQLLRGIAGEGDGRKLMSMLKALGVPGTDQMVPASLLKELASIGDDIRKAGAGNRVESAAQNAVLESLEYVATNPGVGSQAWVRHRMALNDYAYAYAAQANPGIFRDGVNEARERSKAVKREK